MFEYKQILDVLGRKILDFRGYPAIEAEVLSEDGSVGRASAAFCIRETDYAFSQFCSCERRQLLELAASEAVHHINTVLADAVIGENILQQSHIDRILLRTEGEGIKEEFYRKAVLAVSLAAARTAAECLGMPLYRYLGGMRTGRMPALQMRFMENQSNTTSAEGTAEIFVLPAEGMNFRDTVKMGAAGFLQYQKILEEKEHENCEEIAGGERKKGEPGNSLRRRMHLIQQAFENVGYEPEHNFLLAWKFSGGAQGDFTKADEDSLTGLSKKGIEGTVLAVSQANTVTGLMELANRVHATEQISVDITERKNGDPIWAELALALGADWIRLGAPGDPAYTASYNQLLRVEETL